MATEKLGLHQPDFANEIATDLTGISQAMQKVEDDLRKTSKANVVESNLVVDLDGTGGGAEITVSGNTIQGNPLSHTNPVTIRRVQKNQYDKDTLHGLELGGWGVDGSTEVRNTSVRNINPILVTPGRDYTLLYNLMDGLSDLVVLDENKAFVAKFTEVGHVIIPPTGRYLSFEIKHSMDVDFEDLLRIQLEYGDVSSSYANYSASDLAVDWATGDGVGRKVNNVADTHNLSTGEVVVRIKAIKATIVSKQAGTNVDAWVMNPITDSVALSTMDGNIMVDGMVEVDKDAWDDVVSQGKFFKDVDGVVKLVVAQGLYADVEAANTALGSKDVCYVLAESNYVRAFVDSQVCLYAPGGMIKIVSDDVVGATPKLDIVTPNSTAGTTESIINIVGTGSFSSGGGSASGTSMTLSLIAGEVVAKGDVASIFVDGKAYLEPPLYKYGGMLMTEEDFWEIEGFSWPKRCSISGDGWAGYCVVGYETNRIKVRVYKVDANAKATLIGTRDEGIMGSTSYTIYSSCFRIQVSCPDNLSLFRVFVGVVADQNNSSWYMGYNDFKFSRSTGAYNSHSSYATSAVTKWGGAVNQGMYNFCSPNSFGIATGYCSFFTYYRQYYNSSSAWEYNIYTTGVRSISSGYSTSGSFMGSSVSGTAPTQPSWYTDGTPSTWTRILSNTGTSDYNTVLYKNSSNAFYIMPTDRDYLHQSPPAGQGTTVINTTAGATVTSASLLGLSDSTWKTTSQILVLYVMPIPGDARGRKGLYGRPVGVTSNHSYTLGNEVLLISGVNDIHRHSAYPEMTRERYTGHTTSAPIVVELTSHPVTDEPLVYPWRMALKLDVTANVVTLTDIARMPPNQTVYWYNLDGVDDNTLVFVSNNGDYTTNSVPFKGAYVDEESIDWMVFETYDGKDSPSGLVTVDAVKDGATKLAFYKVGATLRPFKDIVVVVGGFYDKALNITTKENAYFMGLSDTQLLCIKST